MGNCFARFILLNNDNSTALILEVYHLILHSTLFITSIALLIYSQTGHAGSPRQVRSINEEELGFSAVSPSKQHSLVQFSMNQSKSSWLLWVTTACHWWPPRKINECIQRVYYSFFAPPQIMYNRRQCTRYLAHLIFWRIDNNSVQYIAYNNALYFVSKTIKVIMYLYIIVIHYLHLTLNCMERKGGAIVLWQFELENINQSLITRGSFIILLHSLFGYWRFISSCCLAELLSSNWLSIIYQLI